MGENLAMAIHLRDPLHIFRIITFLLLFHMFPAVWAHSRSKRWHSQVSAASFCLFWVIIFVFHKASDMLKSSVHSCDRSVVKVFHSKGLLMCSVLGWFYLTADFLCALVYLWFIAGSKMVDFKMHHCPQLPAGSEGLSCINSPVERVAF